MAVRFRFFLRSEFIFVFLSFLCFLVFVSYLQLSAKGFGGSGLRIAKLRQVDAERFGKPLKQIVRAHV